MTRHIESHLQRTCVGWFRLQYPAIGKLLFAVPNGGARSKVEAAIMKAEGVTAEVSDLLLLVARDGFNGLCIEMKTQAKSSKQFESQKAWQELVEAQGYKYIVCKTMEEFISEMKNI